MTDASQKQQAILAQLAAHDRLQRPNLLSATALAAQLSLDSEEVRDACAKLEREGLIKCVGNDLNPRCEITPRGKARQTSTA